MTTFLLYCLKAAGCLVAFFLFYKLLLSRDTLHRLNRILLGSVLLLSFLLPVCVVTIEKELPYTPPVVNPSSVLAPDPEFYLPSVEVEDRMPEVFESADIPVEEPFDWMALGGIVYVIGACAMLCWTLWGLFSVVRLIRSGRQIPLDDGNRLVLIERPIVPFSWMRYIVMSEADYAQYGRTILLHERAHLRLGHSWDLLWIDLLGCLQWFNPAMWLLRRELRAVHEFEADESVLRAGVDAREYQLLLIKKAVGERWCSIANSLNHSNLKTRITMMLRKRSSKWARAKALYVLPLTLLALGAFARTTYVLPEDKGTNNFRNETPPSSADSLRQAGEEVLSFPGGDSSTPEEIDCLMTLLNNFEQAAAEAQPVRSTEYTLRGQVLGEGDRPIAGFEFLCSGNRRVVTDQNGRFEITSKVPVEFYYFDRKSGLFRARMIVLEDADMELEFHLTPNGVEVYSQRVSGPRILYKATGDSSDFRFDREHLPMVLYSGAELPLALLQQFMNLPGKLEFRGEVKRDPATRALYGAKSANGILYLDFDESAYRSSWKTSTPDNELLKSAFYLVWSGEETPDSMQTAYEKSWDGWVSYFGGDSNNPNSSVNITNLEDGAGYRWTLGENESGLFVPNLPVRTLLLIDGKEVSPDLFYSKNPVEVSSITLLKSAAAMKKYGDRGRWGAVEMTIRPSAPQTAATTEPYRPNPISYLKGDFRSVDGYNTFRVRNVRLSEKFFQDREHAPLVLWDDAVVRIQTFSNAGMARDIETIEFIGNLDEDLIARYGTAARYGIIKVTSKQASRQSDSVETVYDRNNHPLRYLKGNFRSVDGRNTYKVRRLKLQNLSGKKRSELPLVVADGRTVDITALTDELAGKIQTIRILSAEEAVMAGYQGARATNNGVIEAWTRNGEEQSVADTTLQVNSPRQTMRSQVTIQQDTSALDGRKMVMMYTSGNQQEMSITLTGDPETGVYSVADTTVVPDSRIKMLKAWEAGKDLDSISGNKGKRRKSFLKEDTLFFYTDSSGRMRTEIKLGRDLNDPKRSHIGLFARGPVTVVRDRNLESLVEQTQIDSSALRSGKNSPRRIEMETYRVDSSLLNRLNLENRLLLLNQEEVTASFIQSLDADQIESIRVVKDQTMIDRYGERAANGVVFISLRKEKPAREK